MQFFQDCWSLMDGLFTCQIKKMALGKFDWNPLKTWKPEFQQGRQESAFSKVSTKLMSSLVTSCFFFFFPLDFGRRIFCL